MSAVLESPPANRRGHFGSRYHFAKPTGKGLRLLDLLVKVSAEGEPDFLDEPGRYEFAVIDLQRRQKGMFDMTAAGMQNMPFPDEVRGMIASLFDAQPLQLEPFVWVV